MQCNQNKLVEISQNAVSYEVKKEFIAQHYLKTSMLNNFTKIGSNKLITLRDINVIHMK